jgi:hypothetical protein
LWNKLSIMSSYYLEANFVNSVLVTIVPIEWFCTYNYCGAIWVILYSFLYIVFLDYFLNDISVEKKEWIMISKFNVGEVNESDNGNYGASAHSDYGMITLLATDGTPGLQVCFLSIHRLKFCSLQLINHVNIYQFCLSRTLCAHCLLT